MQYSQITHAYAFKWEQDKLFNPITKKFIEYGDEEYKMFEQYVANEIGKTPFNIMDYQTPDSFEDYEAPEAIVDMDFDCWRDY